jgi:hypothetical protein
VEQRGAFTPETRILEIGPGYGRLPASFLAPHVPFAAYRHFEPDSVTYVRSYTRDEVREILTRLNTWGCDSPLILGLGARGVGLRMTWVGQPVGKAGRQQQLLLAIERNEVSAAGPDRPPAPMEHESS